MYCAHYTMTNDEGAAKITASHFSRRFFFPRPNKKP
jgi:hypothetical protein